MLLSLVQLQYPLPAKNRKQISSSFVLICNASIACSNHIFPASEQFAIPLSVGFCFFFSSNCTKTQFTFYVSVLRILDWSYFMQEFCEMMETTFDRYGLYLL